MVADHTTETSERAPDAERQGAEPIELESQAAGAMPLQIAGHGLPPGLPPHPTNQGLRQRALLQLQRSNGNAHVQHLLGRQAAPAQGLLQRQDEDKPTVEQELEWEKKKTRAFRILVAAGQEFDKKKTEWENAARVVGSAYATAVQTHEDTVAASKKRKELEAAIFFAVLTAVTAGVTGGLGEYLGDFEKIGKSLGGKLEDALQSGLGEVIDVGQAAAGIQLPPLNQSPLQYQNSLLNQIGTAWTQVLAVLISAEKKLDEGELSRWETVDPEKAGQALDTIWLSDNLLANPPEAPDQGKLAEDIERGIWTRWIPALKTQRETYGPEGETLIYTEYTDPGEPVEERLIALGIVDADFFGIWTTDSDVDDLVKVAEQRANELDSTLDALKAKEAAEAEAEKGKDEEFVNPYLEEPKEDDGGFKNPYLDEPKNQTPAY